MCFGLYHPLLGYSIWIYLCTGDKITGDTHFKGHVGQ